MKSTDHIVDAIFGLCLVPRSSNQVSRWLTLTLGFSFSGEVREPFPDVIKSLQETKIPVTSVDAPSSWDIENGPPKTGLGSSFMPTALVSLTAPKPLVNHFTGRHFVGGRYVPPASCVNHLRQSRPTDKKCDRFVSPSIAKKYNFDVPPYQGIDQIVEIGPSEQKL